VFDINKVDQIFDILLKESIEKFTIKFTIQNAIEEGRLVFEDKPKPPMKVGEEPNIISMYQPTTHNLIFVC